MPEVCRHLSSCGFFQKHAENDNPTYQGSIKVYCRGPRCELCEREVYRKTYQSTPPDDLSPTGLLVA